MKLFLALFLLLATGISHAQKSGTERKLADIEKLLFVQPDSALVLIRQVISIKQQHDTIYAMANTYRGYYYLIKNNLDSSIYYYDRAVAYSANSPICRARALRLMAAPYRKKTNYSKSLQLLERSEREYVALNDQKGLATVYGEIAANYNAMLRPQEAIPYLTKAISLFEKANNTKDQLPVKQSLANTYLNIGNYSFAYDMYKEVLNGFKTSGMRKNYYLTLINYSECLINLKKTDEAKKSLLEAINGLEQFGDKELIGSAYSTLSRLETQTRNFVQGELYLEKSFSLLSSVNSPRTVPIASMYINYLTYLKKNIEAEKIITIVDNSTFKTKANLSDLAAYEKAKIDFYTQAQKYGPALVSVKKAVALLDTLTKTQDTKAVIAMQAQIQREYQSKKSDTLQSVNAELKDLATQSEHKNWIWIYLPLSILAMLAAWYLYKKKSHSETISENQSEINRLAKEQESARILNEKLNADIAEKDETLHAIAVKTDNIEKFFDKVSGGTADTKLPSAKSDEDTVRQELQSLVGDDNYGERFKETFIKANTDFIKSLGAAYPELSESDLYFCALLNLKLSYKDLSNILKVVPEAVRKRKYRIRKKMAINDDKELMLLFSSHSGDSNI